MNTFTIQRKQPVYVGIILIAVGILLKWFIVRILVADMQIESAFYNALIFVAQLLAIAVGIFLVIRQPAIRLPKKSEIALVLFSTFLTFFLLEVVARVWLSNMATPEQYDRFVLFTNLDASEYAFAPHPYLAYYPNPNYTNGQTSHNSLGYRSDEFPLEKPDGVFRIVALGGSSTYDVSIESNEDIFTAQLEKRLKEEYGYEDVQVINAGVPGYNSWEILVNLEFRVLDLDPDLVIIYEGTNDVHARMVVPSAYRGDDLGRRMAWQVPSVAWWEHSTLLRIASRALNRTRQVSIDDFVSAPTYVSWPYESRLEEDNLDPVQVLKENPPIYFQRNLENMIAIVQAHDVQILFSTWAHSPYLNDYASKDYYQAAFKEHNDVVKAVASDWKIPVFDFAAVMPQEAIYWADGRHVNESGALIKARLFAQYIHDHGLINP
jgi:lysophospholipase L1-like esterase